MREIARRSESVEVVLLPELGARLHRLRVFGRDLLRAPSDPAAYRREPFFWGSFVMAPWCNRIEAGPTRLGDAVIHPGSNFTDGSAIHGQVYARPWEPQADETLRVAGGGDGWPWPYDVVQRVTPDEGRLRLGVSLVNRSAEPMPAGIGIHPWLLMPVRVAIHGAAVYAPNDATPAEPAPVDGDHDRRTMGELAAGIDATWTRLDRRPPVELEWPDLGIAATVEVAAPSLCIVAAAPSAFAAIAVEPQTHAPQGLRRLLNGEPDALAPLRPGATLELIVDLTFRRSGGDVREATGVAHDGNPG